MGNRTESPYAENNLWFVTIFHHSNFDKNSKLIDETTFLVPEKYANPTILDDWKREYDRWEKVAQKIFTGSWCPKFEMLWKDVPVYSHTFESGTTVKYGYSRTQSMDPARNLWFAAFKNSAAFIVDQVVTSPEFLDRMGEDLTKWMLICYCRLDDNSEYKWDEIQTGTLEPWGLRSSTFQLDSPFSPESEDETIQKITAYEEIVTKYNQQKGQGEKTKWEELSPDGKMWWIKKISAKTHS